MSEVWYAFDEVMSLGGQEYRQKKCFISVAQSVSIYDASVDCQWKGGSLISIHSQDNLDSIVAALDNTEGSEYWIGLEYAYDYNSYDYAYAWQDGSAVDFVNWDDGHSGGSWEYAYTFLDRTTGMGCIGLIRIKTE